MIELFYSNTPNGKKISIMLEEIKLDYKISQINLLKGDQFNSDFYFGADCHFFFNNGLLKLKWKNIF